MDALSYVLRQQLDIHNLFILFIYVSTYVAAFDDSNNDKAVGWTSFLFWTYLLSISLVIYKPVHFWTDVFN